MWVLTPPRALQAAPPVAPAPKEATVATKPPPESEAVRALERITGERNLAIGEAGQLKTERDEARSRIKELEAEVRKLEAAQGEASQHAAMAIATVKARKSPARTLLALNEAIKKLASFNATKEGGAEEVSEQGTEALFDACELIAHMREAGLDPQEHVAATAVLGLAMGRLLAELREVSFALGDERVVAEVRTYRTWKYDWLGKQTDLVPISEKEKADLVKRTYPSLDKLAKDLRKAMETAQKAEEVRKRLPGEK